MTILETKCCVCLNPAILSQGLVGRHFEECHTAIICKGCDERVKKLKRPTCSLCRAKIPCPRIGAASLTGLGAVIAVAVRAAAASLKAVAFVFMRHLMEC